MSINKKYNIIEVVESEAISKNPIYPANTIITFSGDSSKFKIGNGKTPFNSLSIVGGEGINSGVQAALDTKLTATTAAFDAKLTATTAAFNAKLTAAQVASQPASAAATLAALVTDFNNLIAAMKTAGVMIT